VVYLLSVKVVPKMIKTIFLFFVLFIFFGCSDSDTPLKIEPKIDFIKTYGGLKNDSAQSVISTNDGGYIVAGFTQSNSMDITNKTNDSFDFWLLKFDALDNLLWSKTFGGSNDDLSYDIIQTNDNGFAVVGKSNSNDGDISSNEGSNDIWILKLDSEGTITWEKSFGFSGNDQGFSILQTSDNGFFISGVLDVSASNGNGNDKFSKRHAGGDYWGLRLDVNGDKLWRNYFGGSFTDSSYDAAQTSDNGFLLIGSSDSNDVDIKNNKGTYDFWLVKISSTGTLEWEKSLGGSEIDEAHAITKTSDGNFIVVGDSRSSDKDISNPKGAADIWVVKISPLGKIIWEKSFGGSNFDASRTVFKTLDGGFLITGSTRSQDGNFNTNYGQNDLYVLKITHSGNFEWQKTIGGNNIDVGYGITELNNGNIIVVGESSSSDGNVIENKGFSDVLIAKIILE